ncbi:2'-5' RNA ligase family protein [Kitasatospora sp. NPDC057015]|uniref:2'-5' RNA ligase family protein n=1 Tax=Kitasatospora sp. NPDC057015 TaxID=3346001 RepID=UPI00364430D3
MRTVELTCLPDLDAQVRRVWRRLADAGVPSLASHPHPTNRPHLTVAACETVPAAVLAEIAGLLRAALPLPARSTGPVVLPAARGWHVLALAVDPTAELLDLHGEVWALLDGAPGPHPWLVPGRWRPHLSLTRPLDVRGLALAHAVLPVPCRPAGTFDAARSYDGETRTTVELAG